MTRNGQLLAGEGVASSIGVVPGNLENKNICSYIYTGFGNGVLTDGGICCRSDSGRKRYGK